MINLEDILDDAIRYLRGEMDADERAFFEELLNAHPHLWEELRFAKLLRRGVADLREASEQRRMARRRRWWWLAVLILLVLFSIVYMLISKGAALIEPKDSSSIYYARSTAREGQQGSILIEHFGGDEGQISSDQGYAVSWTPTGELIFGSTFEGKGSLGPFSFESKGEWDILLGQYDLFNGFRWITTFGGKECSDIPHDLSVDSNGNLVLTGGFGGQVAFGDKKVNAVGNDDMGNHDFFVAKFDPFGQFQWIDHGGGQRVDHLQTGVNSGLAVTIDQNDNIITSGMYIGTPIIAEEQLPLGGPNSDLYLAKYTPAGIPQWVTSATSNYMIYGLGLGVDSYANVVVTGSFGHHNLSGEAYFDGDTLRSFGGRDIFLAKYSAKGELLWVRQAGSEVSENGYDMSTSLAVDLDDNIVIAGRFIGEAVFQNDTLHTYGGQDIFVAKYDREGQLLWAGNAGGKGGRRGMVEIVYGLAINKDGFIYITGEFTQVAIFGHETLRTGDFCNFFIAKYTPDGQVVWAKQFEPLEGFGRAAGFDIDVHSSGNVAVTGFFSGSIQIGDTILTSKGREDIFILVFNEKGQVLSAKSVITYL